MTALTNAPKNDCYTNLSGSRSKETVKKETLSGQKRPLRSFWLDSWSFEWITLAFSLACFIAVYIVLWVFNGKEQPDMKYDLSLNTVISVLATGCKSALVLVIGEAISQLKWLWFENPRQGQGRLVGVQRFDAASRGPLGSFMIVFHHQARSLVSLGAMVIVLLLAFDPFMQQVLNYSMKTVPDKNVTAGAAMPRSYGFYSTKDKDKGDLQDAFTHGFFSGQSFNVTPSCSTGNCTWDTFQSVGICSSCVNATNQIWTDCELPSMSASFNKTCSISLADSAVHTFNVDFNLTSDLTAKNGADAAKAILQRRIIWQPIDMGYHRNNLEVRVGEFINTFDLTNLTVAGVKNPMVTIAYLELALNTTGMTHNTSLSDALVIKNATACSLSTCLRDYHVRVKDGTPTVRTENNDFGTIYLEKTSPDVHVEGTSLVNNTLCWMPGPPDAAGYQKTKPFAFCDDQMWTLSNVRQYLPSSLAEVIWPFDIPVWDTETSDKTRMEYFQRVGLQKTMENIAASLTKYGLEKSDYSVYGKSSVTKVFVTVRWLWMILPTILVVFGSIFLVMTIVLSKRSQLPLWKSSALASYYHGLERNVEDDHAEYLTAAIMEKKAGREDVRLQPSESNGRLVLRQQDSSDISSPILQSE
ncbi:hypothetical protein N7456_010442 [Penicillium angulare]|uniref:Uncharacterized protein n=1 Tax=Penicillium angulare TaxID=116970 RepID=A0A9W9F6L3_9EURO|nr:hypothetical protein N7456_010442 [Penicillium angulare]